MYTYYTVTCFMLGPNIFMLLGKGCFYIFKDEPTKTGTWKRTLVLQLVIMQTGDLSGECRIVDLPYPNRRLKVICSGRLFS